MDVNNKHVIYIYTVRFTGIESKFESLQGKFI